MQKIVVVPSRFQIQDNKITDGGGSSTQLVPTPRDPNTFFHSSYNPMFFYDPMMDHMEWYGGYAGKQWIYTSVDLDILENKFTSLYDLSRHLEERAQDLILVQRQSYKNWQMNFRSKDDHQLFEEFMVKNTPIHIRLLSWPEHIQRHNWPEIVREAEEWCKETLKCKYKLHHSFHALQGFFQDEGDAAMFKLKWTIA